MIDYVPFIHVLRCRIRMWLFLHEVHCNLLTLDLLVTSFNYIHQLGNYVFFIVLIYFIDKQIRFEPWFQDAVSCIVFRCPFAQVHHLRALSELSSFGSDKSTETCEDYVERVSRTSMVPIAGGHAHISSQEFSVIAFAKTMSKWPAPKMDLLTVLRCTLPPGADSDACMLLRDREGK